MISLELRFLTVAWIHSRSSFFNRRFWYRLQGIWCLNMFFLVIVLSRRFCSRTEEIVERRRPKETLSEVTASNVWINDAGARPSSWIVERWCESLNLIQPSSFVLSTNFSNYTCCQCQPWFVQRWGMTLESLDNWCSLQFWHGFLILFCSNIYSTGLSSK